MGYPWASGQSLTAADLNAAFATAYTTQVPGCFFVEAAPYNGSISAAQAAAVVAGGGEVWLGPKDYTLTVPITADLSTGVRFRGFGPVTRLLTQNIAGSPVFNLSNGTEGMVPVQGMQICAYNTGKVNASVTTGGAGHTNFVATSSAFKFTNSVWSMVRDVQMWNFDATTQWDTGGNIWGIDFNHCVFGGCNKGYSVSAAIANSFDRMSVSKSRMTACNYGFYIVAADTGASFYIEDSEIDSSGINHGFYTGSTVNSQLQALFIRGTHLETNSTCTGTNNRIKAEGSSFFSGNTFVENGPSYPAALVEVTAATFSRAKFIGNHQSANSTNIPYGITSNGQGNISGFGNTWQQPGESVVASTANGLEVGESDVTGEYSAISGVTPSSDLPTQRRVQYLTSSLTGTGLVGSPYIWNLTLDSSTNHSIGTIIRLYNVAANYWTVTAAGGVTLAVDAGGSATFNAIGTRVELYKVAANSWRMHYV